MHAHHRLIKSLVERIRTLEAQVGFYARTAERYRAEARRRADEAYDAERRASEAEYRYSDAQRLIRDLEQARRWGDEYRESEILRRLRGW